MCLFGMAAAGLVALAGFATAIVASIDAALARKRLEGLEGLEDQEATTGEMYAHRRRGGSDGSDE